MGVIVSAIAAVVCTWGSEDYRLFRAVKVWWNGQAQVVTDQWHASERLVAPAASKGGNVALICGGFDTQNQEQLSRLNNIYCLGTYALYPRRLIAATPGTVIGSGQNIVAAGFNPTVEWLHQSGVRAAVVLTASGEGIRFETVYLPVEANSGQAAQGTH